MQAHSPAPWTARKNTPDGERGTWTIEDAAGVAIAMVFDVGPSTEANADRMASAGGDA